MDVEAGGSQVCNPLPGRLPGDREAKLARVHQRGGEAPEPAGELGFPVAVEKREGPATSLEFLGFEVDSGAMEVRLPARKLAELIQWQGRKVTR